MSSRSAPTTDKNKHAYKTIQTKSQLKEFSKVSQNVHGSNHSKSPQHVQKQNRNQTQNTIRLKNPVQRPNFRT